MVSASVEGLPIRSEDVATEDLPPVELMFQAIAEHVADVVLLTSPDNTYRWASPSVTRLLGWDPTDFVGRKLSDFVTPETFAVVDRIRSRAVGGNVEVGIFAYRKADGSYLQARGSSYEITDDQGRLIGRVVSLRDASSEVAARTLLESSERRFRLLAENSLDVVVLGDQDGVLAWVAPSVTALLGYRPDEMEGRAFEGFVHPDDLETVFDARRRLAQDETVQYTLRMSTARGAYHWITVSIRTTANFDGGAAQRIATWHDAQAEVEDRQHLVDLAMRDPLTGLSNRTRLERHLSEVVDTAGPSTRMVGVMMVDLDAFKAVNDRFGHAGGDAFLVEASRRLTSCVRETDFVARIGGDEFALLLRDLSDAREATVLADRIVAAFRQPFLVGVHSGTIVSTVSVGVAVGLIDDLETLQVKADEALYAATSRGRDQAALFVEPIEAGTSGPEV